MPSQKNAFLKQVVDKKSKILTKTVKIKEVKIHIF